MTKGRRRRERGRRRRQLRRETSSIQTNVLVGVTWGKTSVTGMDDRVRTFRVRVWVSREESRGTVVRWSILYGEGVCRLDVGCLGEEVRNYKIVDGEG